jgi:hypothetical protein
MPNISVFFLWSSEKYRVYHVLKIRFHTRLLKPRAYGLWLNSANSCEIFHFQLLIYLQYTIATIFKKYFSEFYMKPVARDYSLAGHLANTLYMYYVGISGTIFGEA